MGNEGTKQHKTTSPMRTKVRKTIKNKISRDRSQSTSIRRWRGRETRWRACTWCELRKSVPAWSEARFENLYDGVPDFGGYFKSSIAVYCKCSSINTKFKSPVKSKLSWNHLVDLLRNMVGIRACASLVNDIELTGYWSARFFELHWCLLLHNQFQSWTEFRWIFANC